MNRRKFIQAAGACAGAGALYYAFDAVRRAGMPRPNVLLMIFDDLGCYLGSSRNVPAARTPHLDALAAQGTVFDRAYCPAPLCNPSRAALFTGVPPWESGVYFNTQPWRNALPDAVTMPQYFSKHGYKTYGGGKIFHVMRGGPQFEDTLFDERRTKPDDPITRDMYHTPMRLGPLDCEDEAMGDYRVANWAARRVARPVSDQPFYMALGFFRPHGPLFTPQKYFDMYPLEDIELPENFAGDMDDVPPLGQEALKMPPGFAEAIKSEESRKKLVQAYLAAITFADACAGRVLNQLYSGPHADNTIVIAVGDNGMALGQKDRWFKSTLWQEASRVPMIVRAPGMPAGKRCASAVGLQDIYPTLLDMCRLPARDDIAGRSIHKLLKRPDRAWDHPVVSAMGEGNASVNSNEWSYIRYADGSEELYNLNKDPAERNNLASDASLGKVKAGLAGHLPKSWAKGIEQLEKEEW
jgi:arylsulfatase A-like enzyme